MGIPYTHTQMYTFMHTDQKPTLLQLKLLKSPSGERVEIIASIATNWMTFGIHLDFDETGHTLNHIAQTHKRQAMECCTHMMREWLEGRGRQPATWAMLIEMLKDARFNYLAHQVERILQMGHYSKEE